MTDDEKDLDAQRVENHPSDDVEPPGDDQPGGSPSGAGDGDEGQDSAAAPA